MSIQFRLPGFIAAIDYAPGLAAPLLPRSSQRRIERVRKAAGVAVPQQFYAALAFSNVSVTESSGTGNILSGIII